MKIDLVYLWVDGNDPKWIDKKNAALKASGRKVAATAKRASLWVENDELKYALRSVSKFAPWINHIYIVTDGQKPKWLNDKNPKITVVDHSDIIPKKYLPTFNSDCIELFIHKIPGLSEHFLLSNDDFFFGRPVEPDFFFDKNGNPIVIAKRHDLVKKQKSMFYQKLANAANFVLKATGKLVNIRMAHAIEPMRKSYVEDTMHRLGDEMIENTATTFRTAKSSQRIQIPMMDYALKRNTLVHNWHYRGGPRIGLFDSKFVIPAKAGIHCAADFGDACGTVDPDLRQDDERLNLFQYLKYLLKKIFSKKETDNKNLWSLRANLHNMPATFCINGTMWLNSFKRNIKTVNRLFPDKSEFEK